MSYILDALRKAEAEQEQDPRATLAVNQQQSQRHSWGLYLIAAALIGNLTVLVWLFGPWSDAPEAPASAEQTAQTMTAPPKITVPQTDGSEPAIAQSAPPQSADQGQSNLPRTAAEPSPERTPVNTAANQANLQTPPPPVVQAQPVAATRQQAPAREPVHTNIAGLPRDVRARFPELSFSTHVFAADPDLRAVVVNGERLREGDRLEDMQLTNITESGVVFRFEDYFVTVSVLDDWD